jgi:hypothetical protein
MVRPVLSSDRGSQPTLLPTHISDLLPASHLVWEILTVVDELDLNEFHAAYRADGRGHPPYDPAMMVALVLYCYRKKTRGSRSIEAACVDDSSSVFGYQHTNFFWPHLWNSNFSWLHTNIDVSRRLVRRTDLF